MTCSFECWTKRLNSVATRICISFYNTKVSFAFDYIIGDCDFLTCLDFVNPASSDDNVVLMFKDIVFAEVVLLVQRSEFLSFHKITFNLIINKFTLIFVDIQELT